MSDRRRKRSSILRSKSSYLSIAVLMFDLLSHYKRTKIINIIYFVKEGYGTVEDRPLQISSWWSNCRDIETSCLWCKILSYLRIALLYTLTYPSEFPRSEYTIHNWTEYETAFLDILIKKRQRPTLHRYILQSYWHQTIPRLHMVRWNHLRHIKRNIPHDLASRICTIVDDTEAKNTGQKGLEDIIFKRGYPKEIITIGTNKARALNQKELRTTQPRQTTENILTFVTTFNSNNPSITSLLQTSLTILKSNPKMKSTLEGTKIIHSRRQPPNLKQLLVKSKLTNRTEGIVPKCGGKKVHYIQTINSGELV